MSIEPSTCKPDELYVVKTADTGDREVYGMRLDPKSLVPWMVLDADQAWVGDHGIEVVRRVDPLLATLDRVRELAERWDNDSRYAWEELGVIDRMTLRKAVVELRCALDGEEKAAADAKREALIEKAVNAYCVEYGETMAFAANERAVRAVVDLVLAEVES